MAVTSINSTQAWRLPLTGEAEVDPYTGEVALSVANFAQSGGTPGEFTNITATGDLQVDGNAQVNGYLNVTGTITLSDALTCDVGGSFQGVLVADGGFTAGGVVNLSNASSLSIPQSSPLNTYPLQVFINTIVSATGRVGYAAVPLGGGGTIVSITAVPDAQPTVGSAVFTGAIGATPVTNGVITVTTSDTAGAAKTVVPTAANTVAGGNVVKFTTSGGNAAAGTAMITLTILRSAP